MNKRQTFALLLTVLLTACSADTINNTPDEQPQKTYDLMFFAVSGTLAETLVLPPNSGGFPERIFPVGRYAAEPAASPDGSRIVYAVRDVEGYTDLYVANRDGTNARLLVTQNGNDEWPVWSPDGKMIAFEGEGTSGADDIYVVNTDGTNLRQLTQDPLPGVTAERGPTWSPDSKRIAYSSNRNGNYDIYSVAIDGTDERRITSSPESDVDPSWSPDGSKIVVRRVTLENEWDILILNATGGSVVRSIVLPGQQQHPSWRPDGQMIAFTSRASTGQPWQVFTIASDGSNLKQQTPDNFTGGYRPVWLPRTQ